ncbi:response regulator [Halomarina pelagica]|uniref:response regulator n=1 Tax=Halomarina pelagica TaxID=2961599 RepID=UPI0020C3766E|nr:response regulator [Halomarina sp. BND7]
MTAEDPTVLVVEDNEQLADMYAEWLAETTTVVTAYSGREALALLTDRIDIVLLDRLMPGLSGDEVLGRIRERGLDCRVALVTAVEPDVDIVEMEFDDYLTKPVRKRDLYHLVEALLTRSAYTEPVRKERALAEKRALLEEGLSEDELRASAEYDDLLGALDSLREGPRDSAPRWRAAERGATVFRRLSHHLRREEGDE